MENTPKIKTESNAYVFIDASNVWSAVKSVKKFIDYRKLENYFKNNFNVDEVSIFYYDAFPKEGTRGYDTSLKHGFYTQLKKGFGFTVRKKELKRISTVNKSGKEIIKEKGNMDVEIVIDAVENIDKYDVAFLFSGDADFLALVNYLKRHGKKVYIFSTAGNISNELKTGGDGYFDLKDIDYIWSKDLDYRKDKTTLS